MSHRIEQRILEIIDKNGEKLIAFAKDIYSHGEPGFREYRTASKVSAFLKELGLEVKEQIAVTGLKATLNKDKKMTVGLIGELDGIACPEHLFANKENGVSHACGHHMQLAAVIGAALALCDKEVKEKLEGNVAFIAVPSEEYITEEARKELIAESKVRYGICGKSEWILKGAFDEIDIAITHHAHMVETTADVLMGNNTTNGFIAKFITLRGKAAHAAIKPHEGINALNAASLGMSAIAYLRETFREEDHVRVHGIIAKGGEVSNVIPDEICIDMQVRAGNTKALEEVSKKVDRAFEGAVYALGAECEIENKPGYLPVIERKADKVMLGIQELLGDSITVEGIREGMHNNASTDVGDLTHIMPVLNFTTGGTKGALHSKDFEVIDEYKAYVLPAKIMALTAYRLLKDNAKEAKGILDSFEPCLTKEEYINRLR